MRRGETFQSADLLKEIFIEDLITEFRKKEKKGINQREFSASLFCKGFFVKYYLLYNSV